eukprot:CAMPEP_0183720650 /NCGR_PEP_ID=MMETSP0737-20130205/13205_1 /TAXON_ID=385413 /ORGANISM="Thalassiosira miniscula, Strain CCMP1093" /LENGTH=194 /DNA_ID=CAMNT_0025950543 /DNA_START=110 /DNA_END=694 /DNA_ORIENTATION=-
MPRIYSSVKDAWNGVLSGEIRHRRASCSDSTPKGGRTVGEADTSGGTADDKEAESSLECCISVQLVNDDADSKEIDTSELTEDDLRRLKNDDPFLYYSICSSVPASRRRSILFDNDEPVTNARGYTSSRRSSIPADWPSQRQDVHVEEPRRRESMVRRNRRFSTEAHPSLVCEEMLSELDGLNDSDLEILELEL